MTRPPNSFVGEVMHDSDQFSVNLTHICGRNAVRLYGFLIQAPPMFLRRAAFSNNGKRPGGFSNFGATAGTLP
jgi:hypothetical protein